MGTPPSRPGLLLLLGYVFSSCGGRGGIPEVLLHLFVQTQALAGGERWELEINAWPNVSVLGIVVPGQGVALTPGMGQGLAVPGSAKGWVILKPSPYSGLSSHPPLSTSMKPHSLFCPC